MQDLTKYWLTQLPVPTGHYSAVELTFSVFDSLAVTNSFYGSAYYSSGAGFASK